MPPYHPTAPPKHTCVVEKRRKRRRPTSDRYFHCDNHPKATDLLFHAHAPVQPAGFWSMR